MRDDQLQICSFEQSQRLKAAGFDWESGTYYLNGSINNGLILVNYNTGNDDDDYECCTAPTVALALKWMRDVNGSCDYVGHHKFDVGCRKYFGWHNGLSVNRSEFRRDEITRFDTCDDAESALLDELLNILETEKTKES